MFAFLSLKSEGLSPSPPQSGVHDLGQVMHPLCAFIPATVKWDHLSPWGIARFPEDETCNHACRKAAHNEGLTLF